MNEIVNQFRRIFSDDGRGDKDFTKQETRLREAQKYLQEATDALSKAASLLTAEVQSKGLP